MLLCSISLISFGFSSWTIGGTVSGNAEGSIEVDQLVSSGNCVKLNIEFPNNGIVDLRYYDAGFIDSSNHISNNGIFTVHYKLDFERCLENLKNVQNLNNLIVNLELLYSDQTTSCLLFENYFTGFEIKFYEQIYTVNGVVQYGTELTSVCSSSSFVKNNQNKSIDIDLEFNNFFTNYSYGYIYFYISYNFVYTGTDFETDIYNFLFTDKLSFIVKSKINGS